MVKLYDVSLALEPREREEERVTRMLHDSVSGGLCQVWDMADGLYRGSSKLAVLVE